MRVVLLLTTPFLIVLVLYTLLNTPFIIVLLHMRVDPLLAVLIVLLHRVDDARREWATIIGVITSDPLNPPNPFFTFCGLRLYVDDHAAAKLARRPHGQDGCT